MSRHREVVRRTMELYILKGISRINRPSLKNHVRRLARVLSRSSKRMSEWKGRNQFAFQEPKVFILSSSQTLQPGDIGHGLGRTLSPPYPSTFLQLKVPLEG